MPSDAYQRPPVNPWVIALTVTLATFMEVLDTSVANVALPHIAGSLSAGQDESTWILTSYLVSNAIVLPMSGWFSQMIGRKRFYMSCVAIFTISSFLCGLAPSLGMLIFFRVLQGAGGWITDNFEWRWIFFINIPVGIISLLLTNRLISDPPYMKEQKRTGFKIDYIGLGLLALGLGTLQVVLDKGQRDDWFSSHLIVIMTAISATALIAVVIWEWFHKDPIIDLHLFKDRSFAVGNMLMFMVGFALMSSTVLLPLFMQTVMGYTAEQAGLALMPGGLAILVAMPLVGFLLGRYDARRLLLFGMAMLSFALFHMTRFDTAVDFRTVATARVFQAIGLAFLFVPINTAAYAFIPKNKSNAASGLINLARNIGGSIGISLVTTMLARRTQFHQANLNNDIHAGSPQLQAMIAETTRALIAKGSSAYQASHQAYAIVANMLDRQATMLAYIDNFWLLGVSVLVMLPFVFLMKKVKPGGPMAVH